MTAARTALRDLQRAAAAAGPPPGDHPAGHVLGVEPPVAHPLLAPGPAVRDVQPGEFLVAQQRGDRGMVDPPQLRAPGAAHRNARPARARSTSAGESGFRPGASRRGRDLLGEGLQPRRSAAVLRSRSERLGQDRVVDVDPPGQADVPHLRRGQPGGRLRGHQQREAGAGGRRRGDPLELAGVDLQQGLQPVAAGAGVPVTGLATPGTTGTGQVGGVQAEQGLVVVGIGRARGRPGVGGTGAPTALAHAAAIEHGSPHRPS